MKKTRINCDSENREAGDFCSGSKLRQYFWDTKFHKSTMIYKGVRKLYFHHTYKNVF